MENSINELEAYLINHPYDLIRICNDMMADEIKTGKDWLKELKAGKITEDWYFIFFEDDDADYYDTRIEMY